MNSEFVVQNDCLIFVQKLEETETIASFFETDVMATLNKL
jgi:hypothetical protein